MFHLLLENDKKELQGEYRRRIWLIILVTFLFVVVISGFLLLPSILLTRSKEKLISEKAGEIKATQNTENDQAIAAKVNLYQQKINLLAQTASSTAFSGLLSGLVSDASGQVSITSVLFTNTAGTPFMLTVTGTALSRQSLVAFTRALQNNGAFSKVDLPVSDLAKEKNIPFTIKLSGKQ